MNPRPLHVEQPERDAALEVDGIDVGDLTELGLRVLLLDGLEGGLASLLDEGVEVLGNDANLRENQRTTRGGEKTRRKMR